MKKNRIAFAILAVPAAFAAYVSFHPGVAYAETRLAGLPVAQMPQAGTYNIDPVHTFVGFEIQHLGISRVQGRFEKSSGAIIADPKNLNASSINFTVQADSVNTAVAPRDTHLKSDAFFDVAKYPTISFKSTNISKKGKGYVAQGLLTIKSVSKPITINFKAYGPITDPWGGTRVGFVADPVTINRQDYGVAYNDKLPDGTPAVGNEATIKLSVEAVLDKGTK